MSHPAERATQKPTTWARPGPGRVQGCLVHKKPPPLGPYSRTMPSPTLLPAPPSVPPNKQTWVQRQQARESDGERASVCVRERASVCVRERGRESHIHARKGERGCCNPALERRDNNSQGFDCSTGTPRSEFGLYCLVCAEFTQDRWLLNRRHIS